MTIKDVTSMDHVSRIVDLSLGIQEEFGLIQLRSGDVWYVSRLVVETVNQIIERDSITDVQAVVSLVWNKATKLCSTFTAERMLEQGR